MNTPGKGEDIFSPIDLLRHYYHFLLSKHGKDHCSVELLIGSNSIDSSVDITGEILLASSLQEVMESYKLSINTVVNILYKVHYPRVRVTRSTDSTCYHDIHDVFVIIPVVMANPTDIDANFINKASFRKPWIARTSFTPLELVRGYIHSHLPIRRNKDVNWFVPCLGHSEFDTFITASQNEPLDEHNMAIYSGFLDVFLQTESTEGGPYIYMDLPMIMINNVTPTTRQYRNAINYCLCHDVTPILTTHHGIMSFKLLDPCIEIQKAIGGNSVVIVKNGKGFIFAYNENDVIHERASGYIKFKGKRVDVSIIEDDSDIEFNVASLEEVDKINEVLGLFLYIHQQTKQKR
jgi:hypothetical protein